MANPECDNYMNIDPAQLRRLVDMLGWSSHDEVLERLRAATPTTVFELFKLFGVDHG